MTALLTPSQTAGPYLAIGLPWLDGPFAVAEGTPGAITITGVIWDGAGEPVHDAPSFSWRFWRKNPVLPGWLPNTPIPAPG